MYLAEFEKSVVQCCIDCAPPKPGSTADLWWHTYARLVRGVDAVPGWSAAVRYMLTPGVGLQQTLLFSAPTASERQLRQCAAAFTRLEVACEDSVELPFSRARYDSIMRGFPGLRCFVDASHRTSKAWFACDFRVTPLLDDLLGQAQDLRLRMGYQANIRPLKASPAQLKQTKRNALEVRSIPGVSAGAADMQERLADGLAEAVAVVDEYLAVDTPEVGTWLTRALEQAFERRYGKVGFESPGFTCEDGGFDDQLSAPAFGVARESDYLAAHALGHEEAMSALGARLSDDLMASHARRARVPVVTSRTTARDVVAWAPFDEPLARSIDVATLPEPQSGDGSVFISYQHDDLPRVVPVIEHLRARGWRVWYDREIHGGMEWAERIEERLRQCFVLVVCLSARAVESTFVRKEVTFADACRTTIVPVRLESVQLRRGLGVMLAAVQQLECDAPEFTALLDAAVQAAAERVGISRP